MSEQSVSSPTPDPTVKFGRRRFFAGLLAGGLGGGLLATGLRAVALGGPLGWGPGGWHGRHEWDPAAAKERLEFGADWMLSRVGATEAQRERVKVQLGEALRELAPLREEHRRNRQAILERLAQPTVDRAALEQLRQAELELAERASRRLLQTVAEVAEVLTPDQRVALVQRLERFHPH
ncbi:MAG TPA: periplasmic heavy metal sensor [Candidatus Methylomirabilis sp.]|nr:periplasmic heavy metal sensor [Candidatus Methylomirabilis sp.]